MKRTFCTFAAVAVIVAGSSGQGTVQFSNSGLSIVKYQDALGTATVGAPAGVKIGLFWGMNSNELTLALPTATIGATSGVFNNGSAYPLPGTQPGDTVFVKFAGWLKKGAATTDNWRDSTHYSESEIVRTAPLGPTNGPGTIIWQGATGTNPNRVRAFTIGPLERLVQTIDFPELTPRTFGDEPFELNAVASSGLPVTYSSSDLSVATISGSIVTIREAGTTVITASQAGDFNSLPAMASRTLVVQKAAAQVILGSLTQHYDGTDRFPSVDIIPPDRGLYVTLTYDGRLPPFLPVNPGTYEVIATIQNRNYSGGATAIFTILKALQTTTFPEPPRTTVGASPLFLAVTASSGLPVTLVSSDPSVVLVYGRSVSPESAGFATVTASQAGSIYYQAAANVTRTVYVDCLLQRVFSAGGSISVNPDLATYPAGTVVALTANATPGYGFIRWDGALSGNENPANLTMDRNKGVTAVFASLAVTAAVQGSGVVIKEPDLPYYALNQRVTLRAQPDRLRKFEAWTDGNRENPRIITVGEHNSYTAVFVPETPLETVTIGGVSRVAPVGMPALMVDGVFVVQSNVFVRGSALISLVSTFPQVSLLYTLNGSEPGFASTLYLGPVTLGRPAMLRAVAYNVDFTQAVQSDPLEIQVLPRLTAGTTGGGIVTVDPPAGAYFGDGTARITANAESGWTFLQWLGDATGLNPVVSVSMNHARCVQAMFGTSVDDVVVGGGNVARSPVSPLYPYGEIVRLTAVPPLGSYFAFWANAAVGTDNPLHFNVTTAQPTVTAIFAPLPSGSHAMTVIPEGFGHVDQRPRGNRYAAGTMVVLTALPDEGQSFLGWSGDATGTQNPLVISMTQSRAVVARFSARPRLTVLSCESVASSDAVNVMLTGEYGGSYVIEAAETAGATAWAQRGILATPFGSAQYVEPSPRERLQRSYRARSAGFVR